MTRRNAPLAFAALALLPVVPFAVLRAADPATGGGFAPRTAVSSAVEDPLGRLPKPVDPEEIFKRQCVPCHGPRGEGDGPAAVAFDPRPANLSDPELIGARTDAELRSVLEKGKGSMPGFGPILESADLDSLVVYVRALSGGR